MFIHLPFAICCWLINLIVLLHCETPPHKDTLGQKVEFPLILAYFTPFWTYFASSTYFTHFGQKCPTLKSRHRPVISAYFTPFSWCSLTQVGKREEFFPDQKIVAACGTVSDQAARSQIIIILNYYYKVYRNTLRGIARAP